ncbi:SDR family oxidoreductase [Pelagibacteraceae bacterium]|nr:SDR family oxidoreductase [Pelagibacteraceae bacterium]
MRKILVTGGLGYVGTVLVNELIKRNYHVNVIDLGIYGNNTYKNNNLKIFIGDIRNQKLFEESVLGCDTVIHLACISNDPSFDLDPHLGKSINLDAFRPMVEISQKNGVDRFVYASSSSVYGIKDENNVDETFSLQPLTDYSLYKAECEKILQEYESDSFTTTVLRPATVCGYSPRQRFDLVVNILTNLAFNKNIITVFGGKQLRPNIHINDMVNAYIQIIETSKEKIAGEIFNVGFQNMSVLEIANMVKNNMKKNIDLKIEKTDDNRSYHISSKKIINKLNFKTSFTVENAIQDLIKSFDNNLFKNSLENENYFNIKKMNSINLK